VLGVKVAPSTVWQIPTRRASTPQPEPTATTWADFLRAQATALLAADVIETVTLTGARLYILAVTRTCHPPRPDPGRHRSLDHRMGSSSRPQPRHGPAGGRVERPVPYSRPRRHVPAALRCEPRRRGNRGRAQRCAHAPDECDHETMGADVPTRAARPLPGTSATSYTPCANTRRSPTRIGHIKAWPTADHFSHYPKRSRIRTDLPTSTSADVIVSTASSMSTNGSSLDRVGLVC
jgi:hypothetical protein